jgi:hypothetical protein
MTARKKSPKRDRGAVIVRGTRRPEVDVQKLSRAIGALMAAKLEREARADHEQRGEKEVSS